ncbi:MAG: DinB family protein [Dehalococcoidia bacterium]|nr:DinB family protein [Dehalococcoidia bacterium]MBK9545117.1 DinB family protein [Dehalococcoidia bacterium]
MRYVRQAGSDPAFLLKALGEAGGELQRAFYGIPERELQREAGAPDEGWSLLAIPYHVREVERGVQAQLETILASRHAGIRNVDLDDIPFREDYIEEDVEELLEEFHYLRRRSTYLLWDIDDRDWERTGEHPYRGSVSVLQIAREMYQHDLEHLWQARRMMDALAARAAR